MGFDGAELKRAKQQREQQQQTQAANTSTGRTSAGGYAIDCHACKLANGMDATSVQRFGLIIRVIGLIIATPSAVGMLAGTWIMVLSLIHPNRGAFGFSGFAAGGAVFAFTATGGLVGWLLLTQKKAFVCRRCGYMMDRA